MFDLSLVGGESGSIDQESPGLHVDDGCSKGLDPLDVVVALTQFIKLAE